MKFKFKKIIIGMFCISSLANAETVPKYEGYGNIYKEFEIYYKFQNYSFFHLTLIFVKEIKKS